MPQCAAPSATTSSARRSPRAITFHTLFRPEPFFSQPEKGIRWADEVECLLDLHGMRLESQALVFVERLIPKPKS